MSAPTKPRDELADLFTRRLKDYVAAINELVAAAVEDDASRRARGLARLANVIRWSQGVADVLGRRRVLLEREAIKGKVEREAVRFALASEIPEVPRVPFEDAIEQLIDRTPVGIASELADKAGRVADVYNFEHGFALARVVDRNVTARVQKLLENVLTLGGTRPRAVEAIADLTDFSLGYAQTVFRTNLNTAYTAGRFREAAEPFTREVMPAFEYLAIEDSDVRRGRVVDQGENHKALHGLIARTDWAGWNEWAPPNGYNCRCTIRLVSIFELERRGLYTDGAVEDPQVPAEAAHHPNFGGPRPDFALYFGMRS